MKWEVVLTPLSLICPVLSFKPSKGLCALCTESQTLTVSICCEFSSVQSLSCVWLCDPMNRRPPCPSPTPGVHPNPCWWCPPTISSSVVPFSSWLQSFPAPGSFPVSRLFTSGQSLGASASVLPKNIWGWFPLGLTGLNSLQSKGLLRVFWLFTKG